MLPVRKNVIHPLIWKSSPTTTTMAVLIVFSVCFLLFFITTPMNNIGGVVTTTAYAASLKTASSDDNKDHRGSHQHHPFSTPTTTNKAPNNEDNCITNPWPSYYSNVLKMGEKLEANTAMLTTTSFAYLNDTTGIFAVYAILPKHRDVWTTAISTSQTATIENMKHAAVSNNQIVYNFGCMLGLGSVARAAYVTLVPKAGVQVFDTNGHLYCSPTTVYPAAIGVPSTAQLVLEDNCGITLYTSAPLTSAVWGSNSWVCGEVHIVPHSHDDVGWLLTPERYYDGCYDPNGGVQSIIRTMVEALFENPIRRFIQVEQYFFHRWWLRQSDQLKVKARTVIERGQLVFINGGWSMHDEAGVHQESAISNWARGIQFVDGEFGPAGGNVSVGWHIDPFGHASATPRMMAQLGFNSFFFWRTDYQQANHMKATKTLETVWSSSPSLGDEVLMFTSIMPDGYCKGCGDSFDSCPSPFCCFTCMDANGPPWWKQVFDTQLRAGQKKSSLPDMRKMFRMPPLSKEKDHDHKIHDISAFTDEFILEMAQYGSMYRTNKVLVPWGCDFQHIDAFSSFGLMDAVFEDVVARYPYLTFEYSTPDRYLQRVLNSGFKWPMNFDDYFLDSDNENAYWSGYLTSHAEYKHFERNLMNRRSSTDILLSSQIPDPESFSSRWNDVDALRQALGVAQHHDSITGTARASVWNQYRKILTLGMRQSDSTLSLLLQDITGLEHPRACDLGNVSVCVYTNPLSSSNSNGTITVIVYNSLQHDRQEVITVPIPTNQHISIVAAATYDGATGAKAFQNPGGIPMQVQSTWELTTTTDPTSTPYPAAPHPYEALIRAKIPARGVFAFTLLNTPPSSPTSTTSAFVAEETLLPLGAPAVSFGNQHVTVTVDPALGLVNINTTSHTGVTANTAVRQGFYWYCPNAGEGGTQASGAYIFRPCTPDAKPIPFAPTLHKMVIVKGPVCTEARMIVDYASSIQQAIRVCNDDGISAPSFEKEEDVKKSTAFDPFTWENYVTLSVGMGAVDAGTLGKEIVMKITVLNNTIKSKSTWYVDSQGLELQKRVRDSRPNYPYNATEPVAANFFPTNQWAMINDSIHALAVVSDYSRATASLQDGELEFLMIRRLLHDDGRGVAQALNNSERVISRNRIYFGATSSVIESARFASATHTHPSILTYSQQRVDTNITGTSKAFARYQQQHSKSSTATTNQQKQQRMTTSNSFTTLPPAIHLHTLEMIDPITIILRLQHMFAVGESSTYSTPFSVDITQIIPTTIGSITKIIQTDLAGVKSLEVLNQQRQSRPYDTCNAATGKHFTGPMPFHTAIVNPSAHPTTVTLLPMDIVTFRVSVTHNDN